MSVTAGELRIVAKSAEEADRFQRKVGSLGKIAEDMQRSYDLAVKALGVTDIPAIVEQMNAVADNLGISKAAADATHGFALSSEIFDDTQRIAEAVGQTAVQNAISNLVPKLNVLPPTLLRRSLDEFVPPSVLPGSIENLGMTEALRGSLDILVNERLTDAIADVQATTPTVRWSDVVEARAGFLSTVEDLEEGAEETIDLTETATGIPTSETWTRSEKLAAAALIVAPLGALFTLLAAQDAIIRNARHDAQLIERTVSQLVEYIAKLVVWYGELPRT